MANERKMIMLVDDSIANLKIGKNALSDAYDVFTLPSAGKMLELLERKTPDLILLDINMPEMNGYEAIKVLKNSPATRDIPVIFLTAKTDSGSELEGLSLGAIDYISKPFSPPLLRKRLEVHLLVESQKRELLDYNENLQRMVAEKTATVVKLQGKILETVGDLVESRDNTTGGHVQRTRRCLGILATALRERDLYREETEGWDINLLQQSSQLHDVGKISIQDSILQKPGKLTREEFDEMKKHVEFGVRIIEKIAGGDEEIVFLRYAKILAGAHHEKWNGSGYPAGLTGMDIPLLGRLMAIADVYDALTSARPYKEAFSHEKAVGIIREESGVHFEPLLVDIFTEIADRFKEYG
ncbi:MAG: response regulator [Deltaproteobacteria bacterium]|jgi:putative two-component system response regulator|nr:response regulator [Deltaproteobacteria bacterium]